MAQGNLPAPMAGGTRNNTTVKTVAPADDTTSSSGSLRSRSRSKTPPKHNNKHSKSFTPLTPTRLSSQTSDDDGDQSSSPLLLPTAGATTTHHRARINSGDYAHSYEGQYGAGNADMVGVDIGLSAGRWWEDQQWFLFTAYVIVLVLMGVVVTMIVSLSEDEQHAKLSGTVTNVIHFLVTLVYLHWMRGDSGWHQGDLDHLTLWEQIAATHGTKGLRFALRVVPTVLCYIACIEAGWKDAQVVCTFNVIVWYLSLLGKMPFMWGVRIFGINRHPTVTD